MFAPYNLQNDVHLINAAKMFRASQIVNNILKQCEATKDADCTYNSTQVFWTILTKQAVYPHVFIKGLVGKEIIVRLKWNKTEYIGKLMAVDKYMNLQLENTKESVVGDDHKRSEDELGEIFIRCNNVLLVREAKWS